MSKIEYKKVGLYDSSFEKDSCGVGAVANVNGIKTNKAVIDALNILSNLEHRGGFASDGVTGDGAGILLQIPDKFFRSLDLGFELPESGKYAVANVFLSQDNNIRKDELALIEKHIHANNIKLLGYRQIPTNNSILTKSVLDAMPYIMQIFVSSDLTGMDFERQLYMTRRLIEKDALVEFKNDFLYFLSFSSKTICYKGMLASSQIKNFFLDFKNPLVESAIALVHSRFSTNTFPNWERAHPNRFMIHNGEINTIRGNIDSISTRESCFTSPIFKDELSKVLPVINKYSSDSAMFDNTLEFFYMNGKSLEETMLMMIPECWTKDEQMSPQIKGLMEYNANLMEAWDGPASIIFTDGTKLCAVLDRNGLRPSKYFQTKDGFIYISSETGAMRLKEDNIISKKRVFPGKLISIDTEKHTIKDSREIKEYIASLYPYAEWVDEIDRLNRIQYIEFKQERLDEERRLTLQKEFGYSFDEIKETILPMCENGAEPVGAMGVDTPIPVLSKQPRLLYDYFKQLFAQVTNPPIDPIRESLIFSTRLYLGGEGNILETKKENIKPIKITSPILSEYDLYKITKVKPNSVKAVKVDTLYEYKKETLKEALDRLNKTCSDAVSNGANIIILTDRNVQYNKAAIPMLLASSSVHRYLVTTSQRTKMSLVLETGEARTTQHFACLIGFGANAICPYLAYDTIYELYQKHYFPDYDKAYANYIKGLEAGIVKIISKMGISTVQSYIGSQIFECVGLSDELVNEYFTNTRNSVGGLGLKELNKEILYKHDKAFFGDKDVLDLSGEYRYRASEEEHIFDPAVIFHLQEAVRNNDYNEYKKYSNIVNGKIDHLRDVLKYTNNTPIDINEVEPASEIVKRFKASAMSFGALSAEAHETIAIAMNRIGAISNSGEGGENDERYNSNNPANDKTSYIKQVASGRFGVTIDYLNHAKEIQIKIAQGAKPGEGGQLPSKKVYPWIAKARNSTPGVALISPPPHHDIYSIEDLEQLIFDLKNANPDAKVTVKVCSEAGIGTICAGIVKAGANGLTICGYDGGTGASPKTSTYNAGIPWEIGLSEVHQTLLLNDLRDRIVLSCDSKLLTGRDIAISAMLGAEQYGFGTLPLIALGCVMMRVCNLNTCPMGITTQDECLRHNFKGKVEDIVNLMYFLAEDLREQMALLGFKTVKEMIGRSDKLVQFDTGNEKANTLDMSKILAKDFPINKNVSFVKYKESKLNKSFDYTHLIPKAKEAIESNKKVVVKAKLVNTMRTIGAITSSYIDKAVGKKGLADDTITLEATGNAGNSFGAFLINGITLKVTGDANDYVGKGLSGGKIVIKQNPISSYLPERNLIAGNVCLYGATSGKLFLDGKAGERFAVRNSGASAVVLGVGSHGLEYMTGGRVLILGEIGRNIGAGMSGGYAFVYGRESMYSVNRQLVDARDLTDEDVLEIQEMMKEHISETKSRYVKALLDNFDKNDYFKIIPRDYEKITNLIKKYLSEGYSKDEAELKAFNEGSK